MSEGFACAISVATTFCGQARARIWNYPYALFLTAIGKFRTSKGPTYAFDVRPQIVDAGEHAGYVDTSP
jgi:hypothetical protein